MSQDTGHDTPARHSIQIDTGPTYLCAIHQLQNAVMVVVSQKLMSAMVQIFHEIKDEIVHSTVLN